MNYNISDIVKRHLALYPLMRDEDIIKLIYQISFGASHFSGNVNDVERSIENETATAPGCRHSAVDLGNAVRLELGSPLAKELGSSILSKTFVFSAKAKKAGGESVFLSNCALAEKFAFDKEKFAALRNDALISHPSHSDAYKAAYHPHYRVMSKKYARALPALIAVKRLMEIKSSPRIAIDGPCASGKTTVAALLSHVFGAEVIKADDFFLPPEKKTPERLSIPGGNIDSERFYSEVTLALNSKENFSYGAYSCRDGSMSKKSISAEKPIIVEGSYCMLPELRCAYDLCIYSEVSVVEQLERLKLRSPAMLDRFINEWIPLENKYFEHFDIKNKADIVLEENFSPEVMI